MLGEADIWEDDSDGTEEVREQRAIPEFSVGLMQTLLWYGPLFDSERDRWVLRAELLSPDTGKAVVVDYSDKSHCSMLSEFTTACASYYHDYRTDVSEGGAIIMIHVFPRGIRYFYER